MSLPAPAAPSGRETRLLLSTIAVSIAVLVVLAQFRFPDEVARTTAQPAPAPLERLAARATYDELASIMSDLERRLSPRVVTLRVQPERGAGSFVVAPRVTANRAVVLVSAGESLSTAAGSTPTILGRDRAREIVVLEVPESSDGAVTPQPGSPRTGPRYVAVVEGSPQGPVIRPVYVGRTDVFQDPRTNASLLSVAAVQQVLPRGAAVFSLTGTFIGLAVEGTAGATVLPADTLASIAASAQGGVPAATGDLGIQVQSLSPALAKAAKAPSGVMVSYVQQRGPASSLLESGDVITSVNDVNITTVGGFRQVLETVAPGSAVAIAAVRRGEPLDVTVVAVDPAAAPVNGQNGANPGLVLRTIAGVGAEVVTVRPGTAAARGEFQPGDVIVALDGRPAPTADAVMRAFRTAAAGSALLLTVERGTQHRVLVLERP